MADKIMQNPFEQGIMPNPFEQAGPLDGLLRSVRDAQLRRQRQPVVTDVDLGVKGMARPVADVVLAAEAKYGKGAGDAARAVTQTPLHLTAGASGGLFQANAGFNQTLADYTPLGAIPGLGDWLRGAAAQGREDGAKIRSLGMDNYKTEIGRDVGSGMSSLGASAPLVMSAVATRNPKVLFMGMGAQTGLTEYAEARHAGLDPLQAAGYAATQAAIETGTEILPGRALVDIFQPQKAVGKAIKAPLRYAAGEMAGEQLATLGQDYTRGAYIDSRTNPNWQQDYIDNIPANARSTAVASLVMGPGNVVLGGAANRARAALDVYNARRDRREAAKRDGVMPNPFLPENAAAPTAVPVDTPAAAPAASSREAVAGFQAALQRAANNNGMQTRQDIPPVQGAAKPKAQYRVRVSPEGLRIKGGLNGQARAGGAAQSGTYAMAHTLQGMLGDKLWRFGAFRDRYHIGKKSLHNDGLAFDATPAAGMSRGEMEAVPGQVRAELSKLGFVSGKDFSVVFEPAGKKNRNGTVSTGNHWHFQWNSRAAAARYAAMQNGQTVAPVTEAGVVPDGQPQRALGEEWQTVPDEAAQDTAAADAAQAAAEQAQEAAFAARRMGRETKVFLDQEMRRARLALMEADDLSPTVAGAENQYRDRNRAASEMQVNQIANNLQPELLGDSMQADTGAPTLANDGRTIIGGNGRVMALGRAYEQGGAQGYRQYLEDNAEAFGLRREDVAAMKKPVLVRQLADSVDIARSAVASNEGGGLGMSALEQARVDAERLPDFGGLHIADDGNLNAAANRGFIRDFVQGMPTSVQALMVDAQGGLSQEGLRRLHNAVLYSAYGNSPALSRMVESTDPGMRNMVNAMMQAAPKIAQARAAIRDGQMYDADIAADLVAAVEKLNQLRDNGGSVADYLAQHNLLEEDLSPVARDLAAFLDEHKRSAKAMATLLRNYYDALAAQGNPAQGDVFGERAAPDKQELLERTVNEYEQKHGRADTGADLFERGDGRAGGIAEQAEHESAGSRGDAAGLGEDTGGTGGRTDGLTEDSGSPQFSRSAMKDTEANIRRGREAMNRVIVERADVHRAMYRNDIGWVDFIWGAEGRTDQKGRTKGAMGVSHIIEARQRKDGMRREDVVKMLTQDLVETIARGGVHKHFVSPDGKSEQLQVRHEGFHAALIKNAGSNAWLLTGFELYQNGADRVGFDTSATTHSRPTPTRSTVGAPDTAETVHATPEQIKALSDAVAQAVGKAHMRRIDIVSRADAARPDNVRDLVNAEGWYDPATGRVTLLAEAIQSPEHARFVAWHELGHHKIRVDGWQRWAEVFESQYRTTGLVRDLTGRIMEQRRAHDDAAGRNRLAAIEEAFAELYAAHETGNYAAVKDKYGVAVPTAVQNNLQGWVARTVAKLRGVLGKVLGKPAREIDAQAVFGLLKRLQAVPAEKSGSLKAEGGKRFSLDEAADSAFAQAVDAVAEGRTPTHPFTRMGKTPEVLRMLGVPDAQVSVHKDVLSKVMHGKHAVRAEDLKRLPEQLNNPVAVMKSSPHATQSGYVVLTELREGSEPVIAALHIKQTAKGVEVVNLASVYGKNLRGLQNMLNRDLLYWNETKGRKTVSAFGLQLPAKVAEKKSDLSEHNIKTEQDLAQYQQEGARYSRSTNPAKYDALEAVARNMFGMGVNRMGEWTVGLRAYNALGDLLRPVLAKGGLASELPSEFNHYMRDYRAQLSVAAQRAKDMAATGSKLTEDERLLLSDVLEQELPPGAAVSADLQALADAMRTILSKQADDLVALGMLSPESAARFKDTYLPRFYNKVAAGLFDRSDLAKLNNEFGRLVNGRLGTAIKGQHLKGRGIFKEVNRGDQARYEAMGYELRQDFGNQGKMAGKVLMWRDYTRDERRQMGEVRDAVLRFTAGYVSTQGDIAKGLLFQRIAMDEQLASKTAVEGWTQVPDTVIAATGGVKRYGALAGMYVHPEVFYHLQQQFYMDSALMRVWRKTLGWWKQGKTVFNSVAHVNNVMSNFAMLHVAGGSFDDVTRAARSMLKKDAWYTEALEQGLIGEAVDSGGLREMFAGLDNTDPGVATDRFVTRVLKKADALTGRVVSRAGEGMTKAYRVEDEVFKLALYRRARERGLSPREAADYALTFVFDYSEVPKEVKWLRDTGTLPFVSYTYKAIPALTRAALTRPHRVLGLTAMMYGLNSLSYVLLGMQGISADEEEEREYMPEYQAGYTSFGTPKLIRLPWNDEKGRPVFLDVYRWLPLGDFADTQNRMGGLDIPQWATPNGPVFGHFAALGLNTDPFTGGKLTKEYMDWDEKMLIRGRWLAQQWLPSQVGVPLSYHSNSVLDGLKNQFEGTRFSEVLEDLGFSGRNYRGEDRSLKRAALGAVGVKLRGEKPEDLRAAQLRRVQGEVRELQGQQRKVMRDQSLTEAARNSKLERLQKAYHKLMEQAPR